MMADGRASATALAIAVDVRAPVLLWGGPGTGKSSAVVQLAGNRGIPCEVVIASIRDPTDFSGLPVPQPDGTVQLAPPAWARRLASAGKGLLFLDEISTAPPAVQAALLRVVLDRTVGDLALPDGVSVVAAANPPDQAAGGWDLSPPLANRFLHLDWEALTPEEWGASLVSGEWPVPNGIPTLPDGWDADGRTRALVAAYVRARPTTLYRLPTGEADAGRAWPSPRSWAQLSRLLTAARSVGAGFEVQAVLASGCVGPGVGGEFLAYLRESNLPDPEDLLRHPETYQHPNRGDLAYAVLVAVSEAAVRKPTKERQVAAWTILGTAAKAGGADVGAVAARRLARVTKADAAKAAESSIKAYVPILKAAGALGSGGPDA